MTPGGAADAGHGAPSQLTGPLDPPTGPVHRRLAGAHDLRATRKWVEELASAAGLTGTKAADAALAVNEAVTNSVDHGGGTADVRIWCSPGELVCEVRDRGRIQDPLAGRARPEPGQIGGRGLWLIHQLCDEVLLRHVPDGQVLRMYLRA